MIGDKVSDDDLLDEVEWAGNEAAYPAQLEALNPGTFPMQLVDVILQQRIDFEVHRAEFDELDLEVTDELRQAAIQQVFRRHADGGGGAGRVPRGVRRGLRRRRRPHDRR